MRAAAEADRDKVIIVGAGLAGLTCAKVLAEAGKKFVLLEAAPEPGGRVVSRRTDEGFVLDRGFQVLLDSYPAARRHLDYRALGGGYFRAGAMLVGQGRPHVLANPLRDPRAIVPALSSPAMTFTDKVRFAVLVVASFILGGKKPPPLARDESAAHLLQRFGFSERFFVNFARPFFGGVLLDPELQTSASLFFNYLRRFATGRALLPGDGIGSIGRQLAAHLPADSVRFNAPVERIIAGEGIIVRGGEMIGGSEIVLAVAEPEVCRLLGRGSPRRARSTAVHYFAADRKWYEGAWLCLPPRRSDNPVLHAALISNAAPSLAPAGRNLWSVTVTTNHPAASDPKMVAREVAAWFGADPAALRLLDYIEVPYAVPEQLPGFAERPPPWGAPPPGVRAIGDATGAASIDSVMAGGEEAAQNLIALRRAG